MMVIIFWNISGQDLKLSITILSGICFSMIWRANFFISLIFGENMFKKVLIMSLFLFLILGVVSANDNITDNFENMGVEMENDIGDGSYENSSDVDENNDDYNNSIEKYNIKNSSKFSKKEASIQTADYETYLDSDLFFKVKITDKLTNSSISNVKVLFRVYSNSSFFKDYVRTTDKNGIATLNKNFKVGYYNVQTSIKDNSLKANSTNSTLKIKETAETGCCSFYVHVSNSEGVAGFRRDSTYAADLYLKVSKWHGRTAIKQYKTAHTYFFHSITTSDGWMMGTGGADNPGINNAIENLAGKMVSSGKKYKTYNLKTNSKGIAKLNTKSLKKGNHKVIISSGNSNYKVSAKSMIKIK